jgi:predicted esterase
VLLHPLGGTADSFIQIPGMIPEAEKRGIVLLSLTPAEYRVPVPASSNFDNIISLLEYTLYTYRIDKKKIAIMGFSAGAAYIPYILYRSPKGEYGIMLFRAFIMASGDGYYFNLKEIPPESKIPGYICWGEKELPPRPAYMEGLELQKQGWDITLHGHEPGHTLPPTEILLIMDWLCSIFARTSSSRN